MDTKMNQEQGISEASDGSHACARAEEIVSYLYQEASAAEALDFERHIRGCVSCRTELEEFGIARESIGDWRTSALGGINTAPAGEASHATSFDVSKDVPARQRNALAAIREFFTLSPGWMRAATAFAGLAFCALAVIAFTHLFERAEPQTASSVNKTPVVEQSSDKVYTKQQVDEMLARVKQENEASKREQHLDQESRQTSVAIASPLSNSSAARQTARKNATVASPVLANASTVRRGSTHISSRDRQQLAEILLPQETKDEEKLPRLSDLLENDSN